MTKDHEKVEIFNAFIATVFNSKTSSSLGTQAPGLKDGMWIRMKPNNPKGNISNLLHHLDTHKSVGWNGIHPKVLRELAEAFTETL